MNTEVLTSSVPESVTFLLDAGEELLGLMWLGSVKLAIVQDHE